MRRFLYVVLGLALFIGAAGFAAQRLGLLGQATSPVASRSVGPGPTVSSQRRPNDSGVNGWQAFEMALNIANVLVGIVGIWLTMRGLRAERRADSLALRRDR